MSASCIIQSLNAHLLTTAGHPKALPSDFQECDTEPNTQVLDKVKSIVSKQLGVEEDKVTESSKFVDDLGADSLDAVEMVMALEDEFGVEIGEESAEKLASVQAGSLITHT